MIAAGAIRGLNSGAATARTRPPRLVRHLDAVLLAVVVEDGWRARGLFEHRCERPEHGRFLVRAVADLVALALADEEPRVGEAPQLAVQRPCRDAGQPRDHAHVEAVPGAEQEQRKDAVPVRPEKLVREIEARLL